MLNIQFVNPSFEGVVVMGHSQAEKLRSHERIVQLAAERFREMGIDGISVADLMKEAGLTHGGFYKHFPSRDALVTEAVTAALASGAQITARVEMQEPSIAVRTLIKGYLSPAHRDSKARGCAVVALATDVGRSNPRVRAAFTAQISRYLDLLKGLSGDTNKKKARQRAIMTLSALVGALSLARAVDDDALSIEILQATSETLISSMQAPS